MQEPIKRQKGIAVVPDLLGANLEKADLRNSDLIRANLAQTKLMGTDLRGAIMDGVNWKSLDVTGARMDTAQAVIFCMSPPQLLFTSNQEICAYVKKLPPPLPLWKQLKKGTACHNVAAIFMSL